jgi:hypothetical protein
LDLGPAPARLRSSWLCGLASLGVLARFVGELVLKIWRCPSTRGGYQFFASGGTTARRQLKPWYFQARGYMRQKDRDYGFKDALIGANFCRIHQTLRVTPAMASGATDHVWVIGDIVDPAGAAANGDTVRLTRSCKIQVVYGTKYLATDG